MRRKYIFGKPDQVTVFRAAIYDMLAPHLVSRAERNGHDSSLEFCDQLVLQLISDTNGDSSRVTEARIIELCTTKISNSQFKAVYLKGKQTLSGGRD
jgi:hypothetical protein